MGVGVGVFDGGGGGGGVVLFVFDKGVALFGTGVTEGVTEGGDIVEVNSASGVTEVISEVAGAISGVTVGVMEIVLWRRSCGLEPS